MPNIKSAEKRVSVNEKKYEHNNFYKATMKTAIKKVRKAIDTNNKEEASKALNIAFKAIDKAVDNKVIKGNTRDRYKARLTKAVNNM